MLPWPKSAVPNRLLICSVPALLLSACLGRPQVSLQIPPAHCLDMVPESLLADTPGAAPPILPTGQIDWEQVARGWIDHSAVQAGQLKSANLDKRTIPAIIAKCEAREAEIQAALQPKRRFLGLF